MNDVRIVLDRKEGGWFWTLTARGDQHIGSRSELTAELAAEAAMIRYNAIDLARHFAKQKAQQGMMRLPGSTRCGK